LSKARGRDWASVILKELKVGPRTTLELREVFGVLTERGIVKLDYALQDLLTGGTVVCSKDQKWRLALPRLALQKGVSPKQKIEEAYLSKVRDWVSPILKELEAGPRTTLELREALGILTERGIADLDRILQNLRAGGAVDYLTNRKWRLALLPATSPEPKIAAALPGVMAATIGLGRKEYETIISALIEWTHIGGQALCPPGADTYGEGMLDAKKQVAQILYSYPKKANRQ